MWKEGGAYHLLMRVVNRSSIPSKKVARIHYGRGLSAIEFALDAEPTIAPGPDADDHDGCEDPTLTKQDSQYHVYYTGWNQERSVDHLLLAAGRDIHKLEKRGRVFEDSARFKNPKEATIVRTADSGWRLFFEFAEDNRSKIGVASAHDLAGPWNFEEPLFQARSKAWDSWHLSTGPVVTADPARRVMFYNASDRDAHWRIGWIEFDANFEKVTARCDEPTITPPAHPREPEDTDIAFVASAVEEADHIGLYYSIADRWLVRARIRRS